MDDSQQIYFDKSNVKTYLVFKLINQELIDSNYSNEYYY